MMIVRYNQAFPPNKINQIKKFVFMVKIPWHWLCWCIYYGFYV